MQEMTKVCCGCRNQKSFSEFRKSMPKKGCKNGLRSRCYDCEKTQRLEAYKKNQKKHLEYARSYREINRVIFNKRVNDWSKKNRDSINAYIKNRYQTTEWRKIRLQKNTEWQKRNRETVNAGSRSRRSNLVDSYIFGLLKIKNPDRICFQKNLPSHLELKRQIIKLKRKTYEKQRQLAGEGINEYHV